MKHFVSEKELIKIKNRIKEINSYDINDIETDFSFHETRENMRCTGLTNYILLLSQIDCDSENEIEENKKSSESESMCDNINFNIEEFKRWSDDITKTPESSKAFLIRAGICNPDGTLTKEYGGK